MSIKPRTSCAMGWGGGGGGGGMGRGDGGMGGGGWVGGMISGCYMVGCPQNSGCRD